MCGVCVCVCVCVCVYVCVLGGCECVGDTHTHIHARTPPRCVSLYVCVSVPHMCICLSLSEISSRDKKSRRHFVF